MENNPEALEDTKQVVSQDPQGAPITKQGMVGGGTVVERDVEAGAMQQSGYEYSQPPPAQTTTTVTRQTVQPSPRNATTTVRKSSPQPARTGGGFLGTFSTKTQGRFFFPLHAAIVFFSFLVLVSAALVEDNNPNAQVGTNSGTQFIQYALVIAQFSFAVSLGACVMERLGLLENPHIRVALSAFQVFFWAPALVLLTFFSVFVSPLVSPNAFFGAWFALVAAAVVFSHETERTQTDPRASAAPRTSLFVLFFTSLMLMGSGIRIYTAGGQVPPGFQQPNGSSNYPFNYTVLAIATGAITAFFSVLFLLVLNTMPAVTTVALGTLLWVWVAVTTLILTFVSPFIAAFGNGYYSCFFTLLASFGLLISLPRARSNSSNATQGATNRESDTSATFFLFVRGGTFAGLVVLVAACLVCRDNGGCSGNIQRFQVAAGAVSLGLGLIVVVLEAFGLYRVPSVAKIVFSLIWLAWWIGCFIVLTYYGNFQSPAVIGINNGGNNAGNSNNNVYANGFFFTWVGAIFACLALAEALKERARMSDPPSPLTAKLGFLLLVAGGSAIELGAGIKWYYDTNNTTLSRYAISLGVVSIGLVLILLFVLLGLRSNYEAHDSMYNVGLYLLTIWWAIGALVLTYRNFWSSAIDNGYFSVFFTLGTCLLALSGFWRTDDDDETYGNPVPPAAATTTTTTNAARY